MAACNEMPTNIFGGFSAGSLVKSVTCVLDYYNPEDNS
jgi:hypothetical protein